jgi:hypothetical protein
VAGAGLLRLPERRLRLQPVDQEAAGIERGVAVRRSDGDQDDAVARLEPTVAVHDERIQQRPAGARLLLDSRELTLGHAGIVLERHRRHRPALVQVAHQADEHAHGAGPGGALAEPRQLRGNVEIIALHPHRHWTQPPVMGGKKAISSLQPTG